MLVALMSVDKNGSPGGAPFDRDELAKRFTGAVVLQGRRTFERYGPLPDCANVVISTTLPDVPGIMVVRNTIEAVAISNECDIHVIGGCYTFRSLFPLCRRACVDLYFHECPGFTGPTFNFALWHIEHVEHLNHHSRYTLLRRTYSRNINAVEGVTQELQHAD